MVLTALHARDTVDVLRRLLDLGSDPFIIGDAVRLLLAQRLVRNLCTCARPAAPEKTVLEFARQAAAVAKIDLESLPLSYREPVGCEKCNGTGFRGRTVIIEALEMSPEIASALRQKAGMEKIREIAIGQGMVPMSVQGIQKAAAGEVMLSEVFAMLAL